MRYNSRLKLFMYFGRLQVMSTDTWIDVCLFEFSYIVIFLSCNVTLLIVFPTMFISRSFLTTQCNSFSIYLICVCRKRASNHSLQYSTIWPWNYWSRITGTGLVNALHQQQPITNHLIHLTYHYLLVTQNYIDKNTHADDDVTLE